MCYSNPRQTRVRNLHILLGGVEISLNCQQCLYGIDFQTIHFNFFLSDQCVHKDFTCLQSL